MGKILAIFLLASAVIAGAGMYYVQVYAFYDEVPANPGQDVQLTVQSSNAPEPILYDGFAGIDSDSSPLRYRACFRTGTSAAALSEAYVVYDDPVPNNAPGWFDCFDAQAIGAALEAGDAVAYLSRFNVVYGFDRVAAIDGAGNGYVWHQINACGEAAFDGNPLPDGCPPRPERGE